MEIDLAKLRMTRIRGDEDEDTGNNVVDLEYGDNTITTISCDDEDEAKGIVREVESAMNDFRTASGDQIVELDLEDDDVSNTSTDEPDEVVETSSSEGGTGQTSLRAGIIDGLGESKVEALKEAGIEDLRDINVRGIDTITEVEGIGPLTAEKLKDKAEEIL